MRRRAKGTSYQVDDGMHQPAIRDATWASLELLPVRCGLGDVTLVRVLGDGSSGHAHLARTTDGQTVVVKICGVRLSEHVPYERDAAAEYSMEHRILGAMNGRDGLFPELLSYGRFVDHDGRWFIYTVLSHIPGTTLCDIVDASLCGQKPIPRERRQDHGRRRDGNRAPSRDRIRPPRSARR